MAVVGTITEHGHSRPLYSGQSWIVEVSGREERATLAGAERLRDALRSALESLIRDDIMVEVKPAATIYDPEAHA